MKKLLLFLMFLATPTYAIETTVVGTMWKQVGSVVSPADDVTSVTGIDGGGVSEGSDVTFGFGTFSAVLDEATGDEVVLTIDYEVNKATSGTTNGIEINMTDTASPGTSYFITGNKGGTPFFSVQDTGFLTANSGVITGKVEERQNNTTLEIGSRPTFSTAGTGVKLQGAVTSTASTGQFYSVSIEQKYNQSGTASYTDFFINHSTIAEGSGDKHFIQAAENNDVRFSVNNWGTLANSGGIVFSGQSTISGNYSATLNDYTIFVDATAGPITVTVDATLEKGHHVRIQKIDSTSNAVTVDGLDAQTIDGSASKILQAQYHAIMIGSNGTNWAKLQATSATFSAEMHVHDNISTTTISTQNSVHAIRQFDEVDTFGFTFNQGSTGPISAFAEYSTVVSGTTKVTDAGHGLTTGDILTINGTTSYNGIFEATVIDASNYYIVDTFVADDATGTWIEGDYLESNVGTSGKYATNFHGYGLPDAGTNQDYAFRVFINTSELVNTEAKRRFANSNDIGTFGGGGHANIADGDRISIYIESLSGTQNFTFEHLNVVLHRIR